MAPVGEVMWSWATALNGSISPEFVVFSLFFFLFFILFALCTDCERHSFELRDNDVEVETTQSHLISVVKLKTPAAKENPVINDIKKDEREFSAKHQESVIHIPEQIPAPDQQGTLSEVQKTTPELHSIPAPLSVEEVYPPLQLIPAPAYFEITLEAPVTKSLQPVDASSMDSPMLNSHEDAPVVKDIDTLKPDAPVDAPTWAIPIEKQVTHLEASITNQLRHVAILNDTDPVNIAVTDNTDHFRFPIMSELDLLEAPAEFTTTATESTDTVFPSYMAIGKLVQKSSPAPLPNNEPITTSFMVPVEKHLSDSGWNPIYSREAPSPPEGWLWIIRQGHLHQQRIDEQAPHQEDDPDVTPTYQAGRKGGQPKPAHRRATAAEDPTMEDDPDGHDGHSWQGMRGRRHPPHRMQRRWGPGV
ncbi:hypothetical protein UPYG_G00230860 [Umbra pygmaea]|uniref:Uncharacterized protein n=1 Tax=Umbra pygmaea TaxID=75934 RepID=A0ABD0WEA3_UMBPY